MNGRFFPNNWRPALQEIEFAGKNNFRAIQFPSRENGLSEADLGAPISAIAEALHQNHIEAVMEMVVRVDAKGLTSSGMTPLEVLKANLPAITQLPCTCVHWHLVSRQLMDAAENHALEQSVTPQFAEGVALAKQHQFKFGFEHNEPELMLFGSPESCASALKAVPDLHFVWDFNHTTPQHLDSFTALIPCMSMLHVSDSPLPEVNYHLPLGLGSIDFAAYCRLLLDQGFDGAAILEIGGLPKSGGYGRDTDEALIDSLQKLSAAISRSQASSPE